MSLPPQGFKNEALKCFATLTLQRFIAVAFFCVAALSANFSSAQFAAADISTCRSVSGQFIINASPNYSPLLHQREVAANTNLIRLEPALLAVAAERFKTVVWQQLDLKSGLSGQGRIFLVLHPARSLDDEVVIASGPVLQAWDYRVALPDVVTRTRYARVLAAVLLLEIANRNVPANTHSAEIPAWFADGLAQAALDEDVTKVILSAPSKTEPITLFSPTKAEAKVTITRLNEKQRGLDSLSSARPVLQKFPALTFDQMSWPSAAQINGNDGGVYLASAQLFVHQLLCLPDGQRKMRSLLAQLPGCLNWQKAFFSAFQDDFQRPLDVEKWWALCVINFSNHNLGAQWTLADSNDELTDLLSVPVEIRNSSNSLPTHAKISWQAAIRNFPPRQRDTILWAKLRNIEMAQFRMATPLAVLTADYRTTLQEFLGNYQPPTPASSAAVTVPVNSKSKTAMARRGGGGTAQKSTADISVALADYVKKMEQNPQPASAQKLSAVAPAQVAAGSPSPNVNRPPKSPAGNRSPRPVNLAANTADYVTAPPAKPRSSVPMLKRASIKETLKKLDDLDTQRRELMAQLKLNDFPKTVALAAP